MKFRQLLTKKNRRIALIAFFVIIVLSMFPIRSFILRETIASVNTRLNYSGYTATWEGVKFKGLRTVFVKEALIKSKIDNDEALLESVSVSVRLMPLFIKNLRIKELNCSSIVVQYYTDDTLIHKTQKDTTHDGRSFNTLNLAEFAHKNIRRFFHYLPSEINLKRIQLKYTYAGNTSEIKLNDFRLNRKGELTGRMIFSDNKTAVTIPLAGTLDKSASLVDLNLLNPSDSFLPVPLLLDKYGISAGFDSLKIFLDLSDRSRQMVNINGRFSFSGFELNGERISTETIKIDHFRSSVKMKIGDSFVEIDSTSSGYLNEIKVNPWLQIALRPEPEISFKILPQTWQSDKFFRSLPEGMFTSVRGIQSEGTLNYHLKFFINLNNPDSLFFATRLSSANFRIISYGADDYRLLNNTFRHKVYERGRLVASFPVGPENPDFVPFSEISPYLRYAVMTSEDGSFFYHNGFNPGAFRESMITNIKEKRFARGGSTITMQLVKNVFLTRNKTLARKIEEALIVWMIENKNLVSKERMFEVYLNIIEWGPGIYGINQASRFYFDKKPSTLTLSESIYLASIVPHPKWYKYSFAGNGKLKPFYTNYFNMMRELMVRKQFIEPVDTMGVRQDVMLLGNASLVFESDTTIMDSVMMDLLYIAPEIE